MFEGRTRSPKEKNDGKAVVYDAWVSDSGCIVSRGFGVFLCFWKKASYYILALFLFFVFNDIKKKKKEYKEILHRGFWRI